MGPNTLFDKSFLQSLSADEAVWFDHISLQVVCPIFYVETLADLAKEPGKRSVEDIVADISRKFPEWSGAPLRSGDRHARGIPCSAPRSVWMGRVPRPGAREVK